MHMKHPEVYQHLGMSPPRGFLLHGPPGCGKTLMAHAIAGVRHACHYVFFFIHLNSMFVLLVGRNWPFRSSKWLHPNWFPAFPASRRNKSVCCLNRPSPRRLASSLSTKSTPSHLKERRPSVKWNAGSLPSSSRAWTVNKLANSNVFQSEIYFLCVSRSWESR